MGVHPLRKGTASRSGRAAVRPRARWWPTCLGITDIDPLQFGLIFERFLNPERISPPDIDIDFCETRRGEVIDYVRQKYGERARGADHHLRHHGREERGARRGPRAGLELRRRRSHREDDPGRAEHDAGERARRTNRSSTDAAIDRTDSRATSAALWEYATFLEGLSRNAGVHAAGIVIGDRELSEYIPLSRDANDGNDVVSQYRDGAAHRSRHAQDGLPRAEDADRHQDAVDVDPPARAGLSTSSRCRSMTRRPTTCCKRGETIGVFQMESGGMVDVCKQFDVRTSRTSSR